MDLIARLHPTAAKRAAFFIASDIVVFMLALYGAFALRFDGNIPAEWAEVIPLFLPFAILSKVAANLLLRLHKMNWRFVGARDELRVFLAAALGSTFFAVTTFLGHDLVDAPALPRGVFLIDFVLTFVGVGAVRVSRRVFLMLFGGARRGAPGRRTLIVGAGEAAERLLRDITRAPGYTIVGLIDDDPMKQGTYLHGVRVLGNRSKLAASIQDERVDEVIVAMPSGAGTVIRDVVSTARTAGAPSVRIVPGMDDILSGRVGPVSIRDVNVEDLLGRDTVVLDMDAIGAQLFGRTVLITGAAGSIGSELALRVAQFEPGRLVVLDQDETGLFALDLDLRREHPGLALFPVVGDVRDRERMTQVFTMFRPEIVFHAAAYKHVPMMEAHPQEAIGANIVGTKVLAEVASAAGTETFVLISTDKAVNPTSVMGASKRVAEMLVRRMNEVSGTRFLAVRFGNVLASRGSLIPILEEQIRRGGPITVTDPAMERYFMTVHEAVRLILKASYLGEGGEVMTLNMGDLVRVMDLVEALIRLSGLEPDVDVAIQFTGARPGEKLREELVLAEEGVVETSDERIFIAQLGPEPDPDALERNVGLLIDATEQGDPARIRALLRETVSTYRPQPGAPSDETLAELLEGPASDGEERS